MNFYLAKTFEIILCKDKYTNDETRMRVKTHCIRHAVLHLDILYINTHIVVIYNIYIRIYKVFHTTRSKYNSDPLEDRKIF